MYPILKNKIEYKYSIWLLGLDKIYIYNPKSMTEVINLSYNNHFDFIV